MAPAELEKTKATINISTTDKFKFIASWEVLKFDWFLKLYIESTDNEEDEEIKGMLPTLNKGESVTEDTIYATEKFKQHPPRYTEASLVKKLEEQGIGRPSTYAPTISTILKREYVVKEDRPWNKRNYLEFTYKNWEIKRDEREQITGAEKQKMFPTDIWIIVTDFLEKNFSDIMNYGFTADVEQEFDEIAEWKMEWVKMIEKFYGPFHNQVEETTWRERVNTERDLWVHPSTGKKIIARMWRYGPMIQIGDQDDPDKKYASIPTGKTIETITLEEALAAFALPRTIWKRENEDIIASNGRFGPYIKYKNLFVSIKKDSGLDPLTITLEEAIPLIQEKLELEKNKYIKEFEYEKEKIQILNGPYWPYIKYAKKNYKIPKGGKDATDLTLDDCLSLIGIWNTEKKPTRKKATSKKK